MTQPTPVRLVQACLREVLGVTVRIEGAREPHLVVTQGASHGDIYSGFLLEEHVTVHGLRHPLSGAELHVRLSYLTHDISGQLDAWHVTLSGFPEDQALAMRDGLHPAGVAMSPGTQLRYGWCIDGREGTER